MINQVYKLIGAKTLSVCFEDRGLKGKGVVVRPTRLSICAADQRYFTGTRGEEAMRKKLPMALIHEAVGIVVYDPKGEFKSGDKVVMIPNTPSEKDDDVAENYLTTSRFRASGYDGFMQDYVCMERDRIIKYEKIDNDIASFIELISVAMHCISRFESKSINKRTVFGVWGDGNLGFITSLLIKELYPESKLIVFGKNEDKLDFFSCADEMYMVDSVPDGVRVDHAFEAVGGKGSEIAVDQIIDIINPEGTIALMGVSENRVLINTRMVLEKGLVLIGSSRSGRLDFSRAVNILENNQYIQNQLKKLISAVIPVRNVEDIKNAFEYDLTTPFKTIMDWKI